MPALFGYGIWQEGVAERAIAQQRLRMVAVAHRMSWRGHSIQNWGRGHGSGYVAGPLGNEERIA